MDLYCRASEQIHEHTSDTDQRHAGVSDDGHLLMEEKIRCALLRQELSYIRSRVLSPEKEHTIGRNKAE